MLKTRTAHPPQPESVFSIQKGTEFPFDELGDWVITFLLPEEERFKFFRDDAVERALLRMARLQTDYHRRDPLGRMSGLREGCKPKWRSPVDPQVCFRRLPHR